MDSSGNALARVFKRAEKAVDGEQCLIARLRGRVEGLRVDNHDPVLAHLILILMSRFMVPPDHLLIITIDVETM